jgi:hypothetical protein
MRGAKKRQAIAFTRSDQASKAIAQGSSRKAPPCEDIQKYKTAMVVVVAGGISFRRSIPNSGSKSRQTQRELGFCRDQPMNFYAAIVHGAASIPPHHPDPAGYPLHATISLRRLSNRIMLQGSHNLFTFEGEPGKGHTTPPDTIQAKPAIQCVRMFSKRRPK